MGAALSRPLAQFLPMSRGCDAWRIHRLDTSAAGCCRCAAATLSFGIAGTIPPSQADNDAAGRQIAQIHTHTKRKLWIYNDLCLAFGVPSVILRLTLGLSQIGHGGEAATASRFFIDVLTCARPG